MRATYLPSNIMGCLSKDKDDFNDDNDGDNDGKNDFSYDNDDDNAANNDFNNDARSSWDCVRTAYPATS